MLKVGNVKVGIKVNKEDYPKILASHLNVRVKNIKDVKLLKRSVDARKSDVHYVCTFAFNALNEKQLLESNQNISIYEPLEFVIPQKTDKKTVVVGSGPAGLFCAWLLAKSNSEVILIERGKSVDERVKDIETFFTKEELNINSNIQFGEGGAGTFSDGKLTTGTKSPLIQVVFDTLYQYGAPEDILYDALPHIGTDYLRKVIKNMRLDLEKMGAQVLFETKLTKLIVKDSQICGIEVNQNKTIACDQVVLAIGHSARDTFEMLYESGVLMESKPFSVGLRVEHLQEDVSKNQYKKAWKQLKPASYKAAYHAKNGKGVYTFCMCPGGVVVGATSEENQVVTNGMSEYSRAKSNANSAILVSVDKDDFGSDHPLAGVRFQRELEKQAFILGGSNYHAPVSLVKDYLENKTTMSFGHILPSYLPGVKMANLNDLFSPAINEALKEGLQAFAKKLPFFNDPEAVLTGVESRSSSPVRFMRNEKKMANIKGLYPCGEGAGYAGGIVSAAVDGLGVALAILNENAF